MIIFVATVDLQHQKNWYSMMNLSKTTITTITAMLLTAPTLANDEFNRLLYISFDHALCANIADSISKIAMRFDLQDERRGLYLEYAKKRDEHTIITAEFSQKAHSSLDNDYLAGAHAKALINKAIVEETSINGLLGEYQLKCTSL